jgi:hypothetical protein
MCIALQEAMWIRHFLESLGFRTEPIIAYEDNQSTIALMKNNKKDGRTKHIEVKHWFISDLIKEETIDMRYLKSALQQADNFTKPLGKIKFEQFRRELELVYVRSL